MSQGTVILAVRPQCRRILGVIVECDQLAQARLANDAVRRVRSVTECREVIQYREPFSETWQTYSRCPFCNEPL